MIAPAASAKWLRFKKHELRPQLLRIFRGRSCCRRSAAARLEVDCVYHHAAFTPALLALSMHSFHRFSPDDRTNRSARFRALHSGRLCRPPGRLRLHQILFREFAGRCATSTLRSPRRVYTTALPAIGIDVGSEKNPSWSPLPSPRCHHLPGPAVWLDAARRGLAGSFPTLSAAPSILSARDRLFPSNCDGAAICPVAQY